MKPLPQTSARGRCDPQLAAYRLLLQSLSERAINPSLSLGLICVARLTELGMRMTRLPLDPKLAAALLAAEAGGCTEELLTIAAMLSVQSIWAGGRDRRKAADAAKLLCACGGVEAPAAVTACRHGWADCPHAGCVTGSCTSPAAHIQQCCGAQYDSAIMLRAAYRMSFALHAQCHVLFSSRFPDQIRRLYSLSS